MQIVKGIAALAFLTCTSFCGLAPEGGTARPADSGDLLFQSGFERDTRIAGNTILGHDTSLRTRSDWDVDGKRFAGTIAINLGGSVSGQTVAEIVPRSGSRALHLALRDTSWEGPEQKARAQVEFYRIKPGLREFTQSADVYFGDGFTKIRSYPRKIDWLTIAEFWNNEFWKPQGPFGFRITLGVGKPAGEHPLNFILTADTAERQVIWSRNDTAAIVPIGQWVRLDYYFLEGAGDAGRFVLAMTPRGGRRRIVYDVRDYTHHPRDTAPDGLTGYNPFKLYTSKELMNYVKQSGTSLDAYWDNVRVYRGNHLKG